MEEYKQCPSYLFEEEKENLNKEKNLFSTFWSPYKQQEEKDCQKN